MYHESMYITKVCITCCDYDVTEKPTIVILRALQVCCSSNRGRDFHGFMMLGLGTRVARLEKNYTDSRNLGSKYEINVRKTGKKYEIFVAVAL